MTDDRDYIADIKDRAGDLTGEYSCALDEFVNKLVPPVLDNAEYAARCSALMIALNRELARCAAAFGDANQVPIESMIALVHGQFDRNYRICLETILGQGQSVQ